MWQKRGLHSFEGRGHSKSLQVGSLIARQEAWKGVVPMPPLILTPLPRCDTLTLGYLFAKDSQCPLMVPTSKVPASIYERRRTLNQQQVDSNNVFSHY